MCTFVIMYVYTLIFENFRGGGTCAPHAPSKSASVVDTFYSCRQLILNIYKKSDFLAHYSWGPAFEQLLSPLACRYRRINFGDLQFW